MAVLPTTHLVWTGRSGAQGSSWVLAQSTVVLHLLALNVGSQRYSCRSHRPVHQFIKSVTQRFQVHRIHLPTAYADIKECAVTKEFCIYSLPVVSACNLLNQIYIVTANLKFPLCQHKMQVTQIKSQKFISSSKILNANQMLIVYFLSIHYTYIINPLKAELNPICHLLTLLGAHLIFHVSRIRVN